MKLTQVLCKQHIHRQFQELWHRKRYQIIYKTKADAIASSMNVKVIDALEYLHPPKKFEKIKLDHLEPLIYFDERHPDWKDKACLRYNDTNLLIAGLEQAQLITNTVKVADELPGKYQELTENLPKNIDNLVQNVVKTSTIFNAHQEKLPKIKCPERPAWVFPRVYGLTTLQKVSRMTQGFLNLCDMLGGPEIAQNRTVLKNALINLFIENEENLMYFTLTADLMLMSPHAISPITTVEQEIKLPVIDPLYFTVGLEKINIYQQQDQYPISTSSPVQNVHTVFVYNDMETVKNLTERPVEETQIHGRSLMKAFTTAAFSARQKYGSNVKKLPEPVIVQCVHSNAQDFHFSVLQLNTLDLTDKSNVHNYWWSSKTMKIYKTAAYVKGIPTLEDYNPDVFRTIFAFYKNQ